MNEARRKETQRALTLIGEAKGILEVVLTEEQDDLDNMPEDLQDDEEGERAEEVVDALERAAMCCDDAISACEEAIQG
jgi:Ran GTPase-activating protein (RanGAP) involved in mRNA processing and transport